MTEKMKYINIMGPMTDLDRVVEQYISLYNIQLEYTSKELSNEKELTSIQSANPYGQVLKNAEKIFKTTGLAEAKTRDITKEEAIRIIEASSEYMNNMSRELSELKQARGDYQKVINEMEPFVGLDFRVEDMRNFEYIQYQFGKMPISSFKQFEAFLYKDPEILFVEGKRDSQYLWGVYFAADFLKDKIDSVFSSLHFERMHLPFRLGDEYFIGYPAGIFQEYQERIKTLDERIAVIEKEMMDHAHFDDHIDIRREDIGAAYHKIKELSNAFEARKYAAKTVNDFYIFVGWMAENDAYHLEKKIEEDTNVVFIIEDENDSILSKPPTKLKNLKIFKPFELFVRMYGLPCYNELDPTPFVAITYTILFGVMFGDIGQGAILFLLGMYLFFKKGLALGSVMGIIGISSMVFGVLFGSAFGFELQPLWLHPAEPENINTVLIYAVVFGVFLILTAMAFNVINAIRRKQYRRIIFDPNGFAGLLFYASVLGLAYGMVTGQIHISIWMILLLVILPLVLIAFRGPILAFLRGKKELIHGGAGLFLFESFIEVFEVVLSYFTNTVSFVRVGAFALSHASMMGVVWMLSKTAQGTGSIIVVIFGNLLVMALEGLIVGIQVLRLEFYEMFSRFYAGTGREFIPYRDLKRK